MFSFATSRPRRRPGLTPMIDVVFLLLVFFMLASQFGRDQAISLGLGGGGAYEGPPRLLRIQPGTLMLNGQPVSDAALAATLQPLMQSPADAIILRPAADTTVQRLTDVADLLRAAGFGTLVVVE